ncbi:MAG TPA: DUF3857 domain-containing protein [Candidatus Angelobacter sp.]
MAVGLCAQDVWNSPPFSAGPEALRRAAADIKPDKDSEATILLSEYHIVIDSTGRVSRSRRWIYRIETQEAVEGWAEVQGNWEPWYQAKPEIRARVITSDGGMHLLDPKTLNDVPVHEDSPDVYSDERAFGGPLPALAPGAIAEEEVTTRDTAVFFAGGTSGAYVLGHGVPVSKTRFVLSHPDSVPLRYVLHMLPNAVVNKSTTNGVETIVIENGPMEAYPERPPFAPPDAVLYPVLEFTTGTSWQQVASSYAHQFNEKVRLADVQSMVAKLDLKKDSNLETIRKLVSALHRNVRYTGVEFGESSLIPQFPSETLKRKYGDCKDKATLLVAMLRATGIPATLALLSAGPGADVNPEVPGMGDFDHAIVYVPATASSPELWIDATAQYSRVGNLPDMDYGRWALIADEKTTALTKIPELTSEKNRHVETREFTLADFGPAKIVERNEQTGPTEDDYRDYYDGDPKKVRGNSEKYIRDAYLADSLASMDKTDPTDLEKPFVVTFAAKGKRGFTEMDNAQVYIPYASIFDDLPKYFRTKEEERAEDSSETLSKSRTIDWVITPYTTEWHYQITAPAGFKVRALPANKEEMLGTARFTQKYWSNPNGTVVEAALNFDSGKGRLTVKEAITLRDAIVKARSADGIMISFDQAGYSLLGAGKIREALAIDRQLVADNPKYALHRVRLARVLLAAGLGEQARVAIKEAAVLDPKYAQVFAQQGWILEHDLIGRLRAKGFDYDAALTAYRKAKQLDPKDRPIRANLGILLEYDADGVRYSKKAHLEEAITEFQELRKLDEDYARSYEDFIPYDLWYLGKFKELNEYVSGLPASDLRKAFILATLAATEGSEAAVKKSLEITSEEQARSKALTTAGHLLLHIRKYSEAADLLANGAHGQNDESQMASYAAMLKKTKRSEEFNIDDSSPISPFQKAMILTFSGKIDVEKLKGLTSQTVLKATEFDAQSKELEKMTFAMRLLAEQNGIPPEAFADITLSNAHYTTEGSDVLGYRVTIQTPRASEDAFIVREEGQYRIVDSTNFMKSVPENLAFEVLARLEKSDLAGARKWLDWARDKIHINEGDDPLSGQPFPHFWTKGQQGDEAAARLAGLILLPSKSLKGQNLAALIGARNTAKNDVVRTDLNLVLAYAYRAQERWLELREIAGELMKAAPDSFIAFQFAARANAGLKQFEDWEKLLEERRKKHSDEPDYIRSAAELAGYRGQYPKSRELMKTLIDKGNASANDLNTYAWDALYVPGPVDQDAIDTAHRASDLTKNSNFNILHTLACLYAASGKTKEARDLLLQAMDDAKMEEPDSAIWLGLASIAEQYGEADAARGMYSRVEKSQSESPNSNYVLAQQRLALLQGSPVAAKAAGQ